jgi:D-alanyl-lipoteichoic acid acyltransferase DltB (MBOAT superfamily)
VSYVFYSAWDPVFVVLLWASTIVDWNAAAIIDRAKTDGRRRLLMALSVIVNLGFLGYFKYGGFLLENLVSAAQALGIDYHPAKPDIVLPIGISFYTFHSLSYTIDVYRRKTKPWTSFLDFALYVTFFPQLVAGPILRANYFLPQCKTPRRATREAFGWGLAMLILGLFMKNVVADVLCAPAVDEVFATDGRLPVGDAWTGTLAFAGQIFCDFAGYSTCAIGASLCLGFSIPDNFRFPYAALGFSDFWQRWHISLSSWLRDYLYIPLGGNRKGPTRTQINLMLTMLIGGLWHGASWTFVVWGGLHGAYLIGERVVRAATADATWTKTALAKLTGIAVTFLLVCVAWVFFRAQTFGQAFTLLGSMFGFGGGTASVDPRNRMLVGVTIIAILAVHFYMRDRSLEDAAGRVPTNLRVLALAAMLFSVILMQGEDRAFIYFQF